MSSTQLKTRELSSTATEDAKPNLEAFTCGFGPWESPRGCKQVGETFSFAPSPGMSFVGVRDLVSNDVISQPIFGQGHDPFGALPATGIPEARHPLGETTN